jgi:hypothetical protein
VGASLDDDSYVAKNADGYDLYLSYENVEETIYGRVEIEEE